MTKEELDGDRVFVIREFLSPAECAELICRSKELGWEPGTVGGAVIDGVRNNDRILFDDQSLAADLFHRAQPALPAMIDGRTIVGFNERWRFYRYGPGQTFKPHRDGVSYRFAAREESRVTFMVYLNDQMTGGETRFYGSMEEAFSGHPYLSTQPEQGTALVFVHDIWHEGAVVESGQKYVLRTDVMYGRPTKP